MVAKGHPNKVIADVLNISAWTVCTHLRRMFAKLNVTSRAAMVAQLVETGLVAHEHREPAIATQRSSPADEQKAAPEPVPFTAVAGRRLWAARK